MVGDPARLLKRKKHLWQYGKRFTAFLAHLVKSIMIQGLFAETAKNSLYLPRQVLFEDSEKLLFPLFSKSITWGLIVYYVRGEGVFQRGAGVRF